MLHVCRCICAHLQYTHIHTYMYKFSRIIYIYIPNKITLFSVAGMMGVGLRMVGVYGIRINDQQWGKWIVVICRGESVFLLYKKGLVSWFLVLENYLGIDWIGITNLIRKKTKALQHKPATKIREHPDSQRGNQAGSHALRTSSSSCRVAWRLGTPRATRQKQWRPSTSSMP